MSGLDRVDRRTPREVFEDQDDLNNDTPGISSTVRTRRHPELASQRVLSPPLVTTPVWRRLTPGERQLERVKATARSDLGERTTLRLAELSLDASQRRVGTTRSSIGGGSSVAPRSMNVRPEGSRYQSVDDLPLSRRTPDSMPGSSAQMGAEPSTAAKRNITQRRSRGRRDEPSGKLPHELTAKRPTERSQDKTYARESGGWED